MYFWHTNHVLNKFIQPLKQNWLSYLLTILFLGKHTLNILSLNYAQRSDKRYISLNILNMIYYSCSHFVMTYGLLFWGHSSDSIKIFRLQKIIRIMLGYRNSDSCRKLFFNLEILPLPSQYILSLLLFMIRNRNQFMDNSEIYHSDTRPHANFHQPLVNLTKYQQGLYCTVLFRW